MLLVLCVLLPLDTRSKRKLGVQSQRMLSLRDLDNGTNYYYRLFINLVLRANGFWKGMKGGRSLVDSGTSVLCHARHAAAAIVYCRRN